MIMYYKYVHMENINNTVCENTHKNKKSSYTKNKNMLKYGALARRRVTVLASINEIMAN